MGYSPYVYVYEYACVYMRICMCTYAHTRKPVHTMHRCTAYSRTPTNVCMYVHVCMCIAMYVYVYVCACVYMRMRACIVCACWAFAYHTMEHHFSSSIYTAIYIHTYLHTYMCVCVHVLCVCVVCVGVCWCVRVGVCWGGGIMKCSIFYRGLLFDVHCCEVCWALPPFLWCSWVTS